MRFFKGYHLPLLKPRKGSEQFESPHPFLFIVFTLIHNQWSEWVSTFLFFLFKFIRSSWFAIVIVSTGVWLDIPRKTKYGIKIIWNFHLIIHAQTYVNCVRDIGIEPKKPHTNSNQVCRAMTCLPCYNCFVCVNLTIEKTNCGTLHDSLVLTTTEKRLILLCDAIMTIIIFSYN